MGKAAVLAVYLQAICHYILEDQHDKCSEDDYLVYNYNRFQACRFGMDGTIVDPKTYKQISIRESIIMDTINKIVPHAEQIVDRYVR